MNTGQIIDENPELEIIAFLICILAVFGLAFILFEGLGLQNDLESFWESVINAYHDFA